MATEDDEIWALYTKDLKPLVPSKEKVMGRRAPATHDGKKPKLFENSSKSAQVPTGSRPRFADAALQRRLRQGQIKIEARLDLHGYKVVAAHQKLADFVLRAFQARQRCLLVITGKSALLPAEEGRVRGAIRRELPHWLDLPPFDHLVLCHATAKPKDGGAGAYYLYLRANRA